MKLAYNFILGVTCGVTHLQLNVPPEALHLTRLVLTCITGVATIRCSTFTSECVARGAACSSVAARIGYTRCEAVSRATRRQARLKNQGTTA